MMTADVLNSYCLNPNNPAVQSLANSMEGGVATPPPCNTGYGGDIYSYNQYYNNPQAYQQPQMGYYQQNTYPQQYYNNTMGYYSTPQQQQTMGYYYPQQQYAQQAMPAYQQPQQMGFDPSLAQQINNCNNNYNQQQMAYYSSGQQQYGQQAMPGYQAYQQQQIYNAQMNYNGKIKLFYANGTCYNIDGSDGYIPTDHVGQAITRNPHSYDRKYLREERRNRERAMIDYVWKKDVGTIHRGDMKQRYELVNPTPDPDEPGFEWDIVDQMRTVAERAKGPHDESDQHYYDTVQQLYKEGKISFARYATVANAGIEHVNENGYHAYDPNQQVYKAFGFGGMGAGYYQTSAYYEEQQKIQQNQANAYNMIQKISDRFCGITEQEAVQIDKVAEQNAINDYYRMALQQTTEAQQNAFTALVKSGKQSDEKGYVSLDKEKYMNSYGKTYEERHKNVDANMSFKDFMCNGGYADMYFDDVKWQNKQKMKSLVRVYDDLFCRNGINQFAQFYDVFNATSAKGVSIKDGELHIELPPEIAARHYSDRRQIFFNRISQHRNSAILPTDVEFLSGQYGAAPPNIGVVNNGMMMGYPQQQGYYPNPPGYLQM